MKRLKEYEKKDDQKDDFIENFLNESKDNLKKFKNQRIDLLEEENRVLKEQMDTLISQNKKLNEEMKSKEPQSSSNQSTLLKEYEEENKKQFDSNLYQLQFENLQSEVEMKENRISNLEKELSEYKKRISSILNEDLLNKMKIENEKLKYENLELNRRLNLNNANLSHLQEEKEKKISKFNDIEQTFAQNLVMRDQLENQRLDLLSLTNEKESLTKDLSLMKEKVSTLQQFKTSLENNITILNQKMDFTEKESRGEIPFILFLICFMFFMFYIFSIFKMKIFQGLKELLVSFNKEGKSSSTYNSQNEERIKKLEEINRAKEEYIKRLEKEINNTNNQKLNEQVFSYKEKCELLERELKRTQNSLGAKDEIISKYEEKLGLGNYNPLKTKVLHLSINPTSELLGFYFYFYFYFYFIFWKIKEEKSVTFELSKLKEENEKLKVLLKQTERYGNDVSTIQKWKIEKENLLKQMERLKTVAQDQIKEIRNCCWSLFGWRFDLDFAGHMYTITSMFSQKGDCLKFKKAENGSISMIETPFVENLDEDLFIYLKKFNSIPIFLSKLSIDLFNSKTCKF